MCTCRGSGKARVARQVARHCSTCCTCSPVWPAIVRILCLTRVEPMYTATHACKGHLCSCSSHKSTCHATLQCCPLQPTKEGQRATAAPPPPAVGCPTDKGGSSPRAPTLQATLPKMHTPLAPPPTRSPGALTVGEGSMPFLSLDGSECHLTMHREHWQRVTLTVEVPRTALDTIILITINGRLWNSF